MARPSLSAPGMTFRAALIVAVVLTFIGCDKPGPGDEGGGTAVATEGDSTGATEGAGTTDGSTTDGATTDDGASEGESSTGPLPPDAVCDADRFGEVRTCQGGLQYCASDYGFPEVNYFWGPCAAAFECVPGTTEDCRECELNAAGLPTWLETCESTSTTPLVLSFDGAPVRYDSSAAAFDLGPQCGATDWPQPATPWLVLDRDGSGAIESGRELFGSATVLRHGARADNGFAALAELDHDRDGRITAADPEFARLMLWADHDGDRRSTAWELSSVASAGIVAIGLTYRNDARCDGRANCEIERAAFTFKDALGRERVGEVIDVHLACQ